MNEPDHLGEQCAAAAAVSKPDNGHLFCASIKDPDEIDFIQSESFSVDLLTLLITNRRRTMNKTRPPAHPLRNVNDKQFLRYDVNE